MAEKRKRKVLTLEEKIEVLKDHDKNLSQRDIGSKYGIGKSTVQDIVKQQ